MRVEEVEEGYRFTVMIFGDKKTYITRTLEEGQEIAGLILATKVENLKIGEGKGIA